MSNTEALRAAAQQALVALVHHTEQTRPIQRTADAIAALRAALAQPAASGEPADLLACEIQPRPLAYPLTDYHRAGSEGPLHYTWTDKPHRLLYDLIAAVRYYATAHPAPARVPLTDAQVRDLWSWSATAEAETTANTQQHAFARAIEAAHGITAPGAPDAGPVQ